MKIVLVFLTLFFFISGCGKKEVNKGAVVQISGAYNGIIPCADCEGINYEINLKDDMTYQERVIFLGKKMRPYSTVGKWELEGINKILIYKKSDEMSQFEYSKGDLIMLDSSGKRIEGPDADKFILKPSGAPVPIETYNDTSSTSKDSISISKNSSSQNSTSSNDTSINGLWKLIEINGQKPEEGNYMTGIPNLDIKETDNKFTSNSGCNRTNGAVQIRDSLISFSKFFSTRMTCPGTGEKEYISTMTSVDSYKIENGILSLKAARKPVLKYSR